ncbi:MAG: YibE/F family protein [Candidatus Levybacteria bacterium]|nr:YibE/F family protein [Candidatus Levybacteria bacterium]
MKKAVISIFVFIFFLLNPSFVYAQSEAAFTQDMIKGKVIKEDSRTYNDLGKLQKTTYKVRLENKKIINAEYIPSAITKLSISVDSDVVLVKMNMKAGATYQIVDAYRLPSLVYFLVAFIIIAIIIVGRRGLGSLLGLIISLVVILYGIVPLILKGYDPLLVTICFSVVILFFTTYLAHGVSRQTTIALVATFISLLLTLGVSYVCVWVLKLNGLGNENVYDLYFATGNAINAKGLLLSGIVIATLGALNDVTVTQAVTVFEMKKLDHKLNFMGLFKNGLNIGRVHGASMVNTLVLAYAGSSLFVFIFFIVNPQKQPLWAILNNEFMVEEIVTSLGGTMGILLSVPLVTLMAAWAAMKYTKTNSN